LLVATGGPSLNRGFFFSPLLPFSFSAVEGGRWGQVMI